jgi:hypothetical protein
MWRQYLSRGMHFSEAPTYRVAPWHSLVKIERYARQSGWELIMRTTNHQGVCPAGVNIQWYQNTQWIFGIPDHTLIIIINYTEDKDKNWCTANVYMYDQDLPPNYGASKGYIDGVCSYSLPTRWSDLSSHDSNILRMHFNKGFWNDFTRIARPGKFTSLQITGWGRSWSNDYISGSVLSYDVDLQYYHKLHVSNLRRYVGEPWGGVVGDRLPGEAWSPFLFHTTTADAEAIACIVEGLNEYDVWHPVSSSIDIWKYRSFRLSSAANLLVTQAWLYVG